MNEIRALRLDRPLPPDRFVRLLDSIGPEQRERIGRFHCREDALRCLCGDLLVRSVLMRKTGVQNRDLILSRDARGKPFCLVPGSGHFNLSHSGQWIIAAFDDSPVGVDIELIKPLAPGVVELALSPKEIKTMHALPETERLSYFTDVWTLKESWLKASGLGLIDHLSDYSVTAGTFPFAFQISNGKLQDDAFLWSLSGLDSDYRAAVCFSRDTVPSPVIFDSLEELAGFFSPDRT